MADVQQQVQYLTGSPMLITHHKQQQVGIMWCEMLQKGNAVAPRLIIHPRVKSHPMQQHRVVAQALQVAADCYVDMQLMM